MGRKKYFTEEERKAALKEYYHRWYLKNEEKKKEQVKQYYIDNKEKRTAKHKKWIENNKEYYKQYREDNKEYLKEYDKQYKKTPIGRAVYLISGYKREDKKYNRGECTLTAKWMVENIFSKPCHYCGETDWLKMGCDRIDNSKPHTEENVVPCCWECNTKRHLKDYEEFKKEMGMT